MSQETPPRLPPRLKAAPSIRDVYWCDFPQDAQLPEFWKRRPVVVISYKNQLHGAVTVIPCSTAEQPDKTWVVPLSRSIDRRAGQVWAICDKPTTVAVSRLSMDATGKYRLAESEFNQVLARLLKWLPTLPLDFQA